jgi:hypothetical protein
MYTPRGSIDTGRHACTVGAKSLFKILNKRSPEAGEARQYLQRNVKTSIQCERVVPFKDSCWLCGNRFIQTANPDLKPQCEHVLPVAQGVIFLQLYTGRFGKDSKNAAVQLEYEYAHAVCNRLKSDSVLIRGEEANFEPDVDKIVELVTKIRERGIPVDDEQIHEVQGRLFQVTDYINKLPDYSINMDNDFCPVRELKFKGGRKTFKHKHNGKLIRRTSGKTNRSVTGANRKVRASNRSHSRSSTRKHAHFKSK